MTTPLSNRYLIYGNDRYLIHYYSRKLLQELSAKNPEVDVRVVNAPEYSPSTLVTEVGMYLQSRSFFADQPKTLIIDNGWSPKELREQLITLIDRAPTITVIWREFAAIPRLPKLSWQIWRAHFSKISELQQWAQEYVREHSITFQSSALLNYLIDQTVLVEKSNRVLSVGTVVNALDKAQSLAKGGPVTEKIVEGILPHSQDITPWQLLDLLFAHDSNRKKRFLEQLLRQNTDPIFILNLLTDQIRTMLMLSDLQEQGQSYSSMTASLKPFRKPPFVINKLLSVIRQNNLSKEHLAKLYGKIANLDLSIKTGKIAPDLGIQLLLLRV